ncbi:MAG TPA: type II toxin-antitoxin system HicA family toxin [Verrucomicrobiae bacterium]
MARLPRLRGREVIAALRRAGFSVARVQGSHHFLRHAAGRATVVLVHAGETIGPGRSGRSCPMWKWSRGILRNGCEMLGELDAALDARTALCFHFGACLRRVSEAGRSPV